jgi:hypothetical protein
MADGQVGYVGICDRCGISVYDDNASLMSPGHPLHAKCPVVMKDDVADGKTERFDLIPVGPIRDVALLYGFGAKKYAARNWESGFAWSRNYNALRRHLDAFWSGQELDDGPGGSGLPHITAVIWNALALAEFATTHPELDDRPNTPSKGPE